MKRDNPIGVFDSGVGGLTVVKQVKKILPNESIIYFGDIARIPYGTKSIETIRKFTAQTVEFLLKQNVKAIVIACNTISAAAGDLVVSIAKDTIVCDIIKSTVNELNITECNTFGVIATPVTVVRSAYKHAINQQLPSSRVYEVACPLLVPFIEEGIISHSALTLILKEYILQLPKIDKLILGCSHYAIIKGLISEMIDVDIIDPAVSVAKSLYESLVINDMIGTSSGKIDFYVTDNPSHFKKIGAMLLDESMENVAIVNLDNV